MERNINIGQLVDVDLRFQAPPPGSLVRMVDDEFDLLCLVASPPEEGEVEVDIFGRPFVWLLVPDNPIYKSGLCQVPADNIAYVVEEVLQ